jgi:serine/threonine-protein kinase
MPFNPSEVTPGSLNSEHTDLFGFAGRTVSHFRVLDLIGAGGMGVVYRAEDTRLQRAVALKFLLPQFVLDDSAKERFLFEARSAAALDHPNICTVYEVGESEDGQLYLAMALYAGETLSARLTRAGPLDTREALAIARQLADGIACAHAAGIVHRDLKPSNVMLPPDGPVKILDFGLAKAKGLSLTRSGVQLGTVAYMAPEQICGEAVDVRTDLWALGVMLYEMLTGRRPFEAERDISVAHAIVNDAPPRPSALRADLTPVVESIVLELLDKEPARRPATAADLVRELAAAQSITGPWPAMPNASRGIHITGFGTRRPWSRPAAMIGIALGGIALAVGAGLTWRASARDAASDVPPDRSIAVLPFDNLSSAKENEFLAGGLQDAVITQLTQVADLRVVSRQSVRAYAGSSKPLRQIAQELGVGTILQASVQMVGQRARVTAQLIDAKTDRHLWANEYERDGTDLFALQNEIGLAIVGALRAELTAGERDRLTRPPTNSPEAYTFYLQGRQYQERPPGTGTLALALGEPELRAAESLYRRALALDSNFALAHAQLALVQGALMGYDRAPGRREEMRAEAETALRLQPGLPEAHLAIGGYWAVEGDRGRALAEYELARRGLPNDGKVARMIAMIHRRQGRWREVLAGLERAATLDPRDGATSINLAWTYQAMGRCQDAVRTWDNAIELAPDNYRFVMERGRAFVRCYGNTDSLAAALRRIPADFDPEGQITLARADLARLRRRPGDALAAFQTMRPEVLEGDDLDNISYITLIRAEARAALGDTALARIDYDSARAILDRAIEREPNSAVLHVQHALASVGSGRTQDAIREARKSLELLPVGKDAFNAPLIMRFTAEIYARAGDADAAVDLFEQLRALPNIWFSFPELRLDPRWDPLRRNARFQRLIARK